jgi:hypothetical protein
VIDDERVDGADILRDDPQPVLPDLEARAQVPPRRVLDDQMAVAQGGLAGSGAKHHLPVVRRKLGHGRAQHPDLDHEGLVRSPGPRGRRNVEALLDAAGSVDVPLGQLRPSDVQSWAHGSDRGRRATRRLQRVPATESGHTESDGPRSFGAAAGNHVEPVGGHDAADVVAPVRRRPHAVPHLGELVLGLPEVRGDGGHPVREPALGDRRRGDGAECGKRRHHRECRKPIGTNHERSPSRRRASIYIIRRMTHEVLGIDRH